MGRQPLSKTHRKSRVCNDSSKQTTANIKKRDFTVTSCVTLQDVCRTPASSSGLGVRRSETHQSPLRASCQALCVLDHVARHARHLQLLQRIADNVIRKSDTHSHSLLLILIALLQLPFQNSQFNLSFSTRPNFLFQSRFNLASVAFTNLTLSFNLCL